VSHTRDRQCWPPLISPRRVASNIVDCTLQPADVGGDCLVGLAHRHRGRFGAAGRGARANCAGGSRRLERSASRRGIGGAPLSGKIGGIEPTAARSAAGDPDTRRCPSAICDLGRRDFRRVGRRHSPRTGLSAGGRGTRSRRHRLVRGKTAPGWRKCDARRGHARRHAPLARDAARRARLDDAGAPEVRSVERVGVDTGSERRPMTIH